MSIKKISDLEIRLKAENPTRFNDKEIGKLIALLNRMLEADPDKRASAADLENDDFFASASLRPATDRKPKHKHKHKHKHSLNSWSIGASSMKI